MFETILNSIDVNTLLLITIPIVFGILRKLVKLTTKVAVLAAVVYGLFFFGILNMGTITTFFTKIFS